MSQQINGQVNTSVNVDSVEGHLSSGQSTEAPKKTSGGSVRVVHGANGGQFESLVGKTVATVRKNFKQVYNIPGDSIALVSGKQVNDAYELSAGETIEFLKEAGVKGIK